MLRSLAFKLSLSLTVLVVTAFGVFAYVDADTQERQLLNEMVLSADQLSSTIVSSTWNAMLEDRRDIAYEVMRTIGRQVGIDKVRFFNKEGAIMFSTGDDLGRKVDVEAEACTLCHARAQPLVRVDVPSRVRVFKGPDGDRMLGMVTAIYNEPACSASACHAHPAHVNVLGVLDVNMSLGRVDAELASIRRAAVVGTLGATLVTSLFIFLLVRRFVGRPVQKLIAATHAVGAQTLVPALDVTSQDEIGALARAFLTMTERLHQTQEEVRRFTQTLEDEVEARTAKLKATEQHLIRNDRLASVGQIAASVAHEINNPLSGVLTFAKLMQRRLSPQGIPPEQVPDFQRHLEHVVTQTARCGRIVSDLLTFSRRSSPRRERRDVNEVITRTLSLLEHRFELEGVTLEPHLATDLPLVWCDASQLQQVLLNLLLNALEATPSGGRAELRTSWSPGRAGVRIEIRDKGVGIDPEHLNRIFDPFFTTKEEGKGTGLGLAVVFGIVEAHGGTIDVESTPGAGTCFHVDLPLGAQEEGDAGSGVAPAPDQGGEGEPPGGAS